MSKKNPAIDTKDYIRIMFNKHNEIMEDQNENKPIDELTKKWNMNEKILSLFSTNIEKDQRLKEKYAIILIIILSIQLLALIVIFILNGCGILKYSDSTFNIFVSGGIAEVFILVRVIVKYLFKDNLTNALNIILENNNKVRFRKNNHYSKRKNTKETENKEE